VSHWRKPPPETERTHRMGDLTVSDGSLDTGERQVLFW
jgi:hypothetical protein